LIRVVTFFFINCFLISCGESRNYSYASGVVTTISCGDIWRSSNVLNLQVVSSKFDAPVKFTSKLWNVDCEQALRLINKEQRIDFQYENAGRKGPILVYLKIESIVIVDNK